MPSRLLRKARSARIRAQRWAMDRASFRQARRMHAYLASLPASGRPVLFFNASTRINRLSLNAAFSLVASWAVRAAGAPVRYVECRKGMLQCILGTRLSNLDADLPCAACMRFSRGLFAEPLTRPLATDREMAAEVTRELEGLSLEDLTAWEHDGLPLGSLVLPSLRWVLRRHNLPGDPGVASLMRRYLASAASMAAQWRRILEETDPRALVIFNGITFPEAVARAVARSMDVPVVTHEVALRPMSAFFTHGEATLREIPVPEGFALTPEQDRQLDDHLARRSRGRFTMAGIRFWPKMQPLPEWLQARIAEHKALVPIFTNVIFDTSQVHANVLFGDMLAWLSALEGVVRKHPEVLFVFRAHPDEERPGKKSRESVADWMQRSDLRERRNVVFFAPRDYVSSYDLIARAKFVMVYNSSIGLEASALGRPVLCAAKARYTQVPSVHFPADREAYLRTLEAFLTAERLPEQEPYQRVARAFLYLELQHYSLDFSGFLREDPTLAGFVSLRGEEPRRMISRERVLLDLLAKGILEGSPFRYPLGPAPEGPIPHQDPEA